MNLKAIMILLVVGCAQSATGQYKNMMLYQQSDTHAVMDAPAIAINPRDPANIVVTLAPDLVLYTKDGGATWQEKRITSAFGMWGAPTITAGPKGSFYYLHASDQSGKHDRMVIQKSDDGGETWSSGEWVGLNDPKDQTNGWATADRRGNLFVTWRQFDRYGDADNACASNILFSMSKNGKKWSDPVTISKLAANCRSDHSGATGAIPVVTPEGKVMIAWSNAGRIYLDRSFNGGELWLGNDIEVTEQVGGSNLAIPGHGYCNGMPVLCTDAGKSPYRGSLYLVWADQRNGADDTDIWFTRSHNFGDNWSSPMRINDDGSGKHQYMPWLAVDEATGYLYLVYFDRRNHDGLETDVYLAYSTDGGASFKNVLISEKPFVPDADEHIGAASYIAARDGTITPVWIGNDDGTSALWTAILTHNDLVKPAH